MTETPRYQKIGTRICNAFKSDSDQGLDELGKVAVMAVLDWACEDATVEKIWVKISFAEQLDEAQIRATLLTLREVCGNA